MLPTVDFCFKELMKNPKVQIRVHYWVHSEEKREKKEAQDRADFEREQPGEYEDEKGDLDVLILLGRKPDDLECRCGVRLWKERVA